MINKRRLVTALCYSILAAFVACLGGRAGRHVPLQSPSLQSGKLADDSLLCSHHAASQLDAIGGRCGRNLPAGGSTSAATAAKSGPNAIAAGGEYVKWSYRSNSLSQRVFSCFSGHWWIYDKLSWFDVRRAHVVGGAECRRFSMFNLYRWNLRRHFQACRSYNHKSPCPGAERRSWLRNDDGSATAGDCAPRRPFDHFDARANESRRPGSRFRRTPSMKPATHGLLEANAIASMASNHACAPPLSPTPRV